MPDDRPPVDPLQALLEVLQADTGRTLPTSGLGRWARTIRTAAGTATRVVGARLRGGEGLGDLSPEALQRLVAALGELKGLPMKVGQILSYIDPSMPPEASRLLGLLQTRSQPTPFALIEQTLREDLGDQAEGLLATLDRTPVAVASIGQVHRARLADGTAVAVKVRHPGIDEAMRSDFKVAGSGAAFARTLAPGVGATAAEVVAEAQARLLEECDYRLEAWRQQVFAEIYAGSAVIVVPAVHEALCSRRVLVTTWEAGEAFEAFVGRDPPAAERDRLGRALFDFYLGTLYRDCLFHADPHPGNYCVRGDGHLVVFDYGCVRELDRPTVLALVELAEAVRSGNDDDLRAALTGLGAAPPVDRRAFAHVRSLLQGFFGPMLRPGAHRVDAGIHFDMMSAQRDKMALGRLRLPGKLTFLFRIRFGLYAVLSRLGAVCDWRALEEELARDVRRRAGLPSPP